MLGVAMPHDSQSSSSARYLAISDQNARFFTLSHPHLWVIIIGYSFDVAGLSIMAVIFSYYKIYKLDKTIM